MRFLIALITSLSVGCTTKQAQFNTPAGQYNLSSLDAGTNTKVTLKGYKDGLPLFDLTVEKTGQAETAQRLIVAGERIGLTWLITDAIEALGKVVENSMKFSKVTPDAAIIKGAP